MSDILIISATPRSNFKLAKEIIGILQKDFSQWSAKMVELESLGLPLYTPDEEKKGIPPQAKTLATSLSQAKVLIICAPEYNGGVPPVVNNAIAWISRTGDNWREAFLGKLTVVASHSGGEGHKYCQSMRTQMEHLGSFVHPRVVLTNYSKKFNPDSFRQIAESFSLYIKGSS